MTARHGLIGLSQTAVIKYAPKTIRINAIGPGYIDTPVLSQLPPETIQQLIDTHPVGRLGKAEKVAELVIWLSSDKATFVTGSYYPIDGGYLAK
ncbi:hypothetical protein GCM10028774_00750 [Spirosoma jeollabukense]